MAETTTNPFLRPATPVEPATSNPFLRTTPTTPTTPVEDDNDRDPLLVSSVGTKAEPEELPESPWAAIDGRSEEIMGQEVDLPEPSTTMYDDIEREGFLGEDSYNRALERWRVYRNHPEAERSILGETVYKGVIVPYPERSMIFGDHSPGIGQNLALSGRRAARSALELGAAGIDLAEQAIPEEWRDAADEYGSLQMFDENGDFSPRWISGEETKALRESNPEAFSLTNMVQNQVADVETGDSITDTLLVEGAAPMLSGTLLANGIRKTLNYAANPTVLKKLAMLLGFEAGFAATTSSDVDTLLIGENALGSGIHEMFPLLKGVQTEEGDSAAQEVVAARLNIMADAMSIGAVAQKTIDSVAWATRFTWSITGAPLIGSVSRSSREEAIAREILDNLNAVTGNAETDRAARERILDLVRNNAEVFVETPPEIAEEMRFTVDTMSAIERALANNDEEAARILIQRAQGVRNGALARGAPETAVATSRAGRATEDLTSQMEEALGGSEAIEASARGFQDSGEAVVRQADANVTMAEASLDQLNNRVTSLIQEDPSFIGRITNLENKVGFDIGAARNDAADSLLGRISEASRVMDEAKDARFAAVTGGAVDYDNMFDALVSLRPEQLDAAVAAMPGDSRFGVLLSQSRRRQVPDGEGMRAETVEEAKERFAEWAQDNDLDFARLFTDIRPALSQSIGRLERAGTPEAQGASSVLQRFKAYIDNDAVEYLRDVGDDDTIEAAEEAMRYYREEWAPFWDDGATLQQVGELRRQTVGRGKQAPMFTDTARNAITDTLNDRNRAVAGNMIDLLRREEAGQSAPLVTDYVIGDLLGKLSSRIDSTTKLPDLDTSDIRQGLAEYGTLIRQNFPEEAQRIDDLIGRLSDARTTRTQLEAEIEAARATAATARDRIYDQELSAFFRAEGIRNPNGYAAFESILRNKQSADVLQGLVDRAKASGDPIVMDGMRAAYARYVRNEFLAATREQGGSRMIKIGKDQAVQDNINSILDYGNIIYQDDPRFMAALDTMLSEAGLIQRSRGARAIGVGSNTAQLQQRVAAVNRIVTMTFGVLSRVGARVRSAATGYLSNAVDPEMSARLLDGLLADPDYFVEVAERVVRADGNVNREAAELLRQWLVRSAIYTEDNEPSSEEFLRQIIEAERTIRSVPGVIEQTRDALLEGAGNR